jgi:predicted TIM-barrel fold metal-dependent hydrolase
MNIDCHVHLCAFNRDHGWTSDHLLNTLPFRFMRWRLGMKGNNAQTEKNLESKLLNLVQQTPELDKIVVLAFDAVHNQEGQLDKKNTHLYVKNDYVADLAHKNANVLFGASVHPYRKDAVAEIERCVKLGAVLLKWLPIVQDFNPADDRCIPVYEALAHFNLPLLAHTGGEKSLPNLNKNVADPMLLLPAIQSGVRIIAAHCGTRSASDETDFVPQWAKLAKDHEHFYGDTAALNLPTRSYAYKTILNDETLRNKLVHGSDWPILPVPPIQCGLAAGAKFWCDSNWIRRDIKIKQQLGFDDAYWNRAAQVLKITS